MILWGGTDGQGGLDSGGRYDPVTNLWRATSLINAPTAQTGHSVLDMGDRMLIWGSGAMSFYLYGQNQLACEPQAGGKVHCKNTGIGRR